MKNKMNLITQKKIVRGDGVVVKRLGERTAALDLTVRTFFSKAGDNIARRGSESKKSQSYTGANINMKAISNIKNLVAAYESIKSNPGNMTAALDPTTLDGTSLNMLKSLQKKLKAGKFQFSPARRINIPKPGKTSTRPLTIASPREKIIQKAIQLVLEPFYDPLFSDSSHGFRPERGTRTAMKFIAEKFQSAKYIIEADFSKAFDRIPHDHLVEILSRDIKCEKTITLLKSGLKAGFAEKGVLHEYSHLGTPQGSILSPLLCNLYLHELDKFMERLEGEFNRGERRQKSAVYTSLTNKARH